MPSGGACSTVVASATISTSGRTAVAPSPARAETAAVEKSAPVSPVGDVPNGPDGQAGACPEPAGIEVGAGAGAPQRPQNDAPGATDCPQRVQSDMALPSHPGRRVVDGRRGEVNPIPRGGGSRTGPDG